MVKKRILLSNATLVITELWDGKLVLGELQYGGASKREIKRAMAEKGFQYGILDHCIDVLESGHKGQIPVALAYIDEDPGKPYFHFERELNDDNFEQWIERGSFENIDFSYAVSAGEDLLSLNEKPFQYLRYPDGKKEFLNEIETDHLSFYAGDNTITRPESNTIAAAIDGHAHRTIYGTVSVYPSETFKNIGKMHGRVETDSTVHIEQDIRTESHLVTPSSVVVDGLIRSSYVRAGGNVICSFGMDNSQRIDHASVHAGQSLFASHINGYNAWAGHYCIVQQAIENSTVQCMNSMVVPVVNRSELRVGNRLFTRNLERGTQVYLGMDFVIDPTLKTIKKFHQQHEKRLFDHFLYLEEMQRELDFIRKKTLNHLVKLNKFSKESIGTDVLLSRFFLNMRDGLSRYKELLAKAKTTLSEFADEKRQLAFYETYTKRETSPELIATGTISPGCVINSLKETYRVREPLQNVRIKVNTTTKSLEIEALTPA